MAKIILGGMPDSNWLPLIFPILVILIIIVVAEYLFRLMKRRKQHRKNKIDLIIPWEEGKNE